VVREVKEIGYQAWREKYRYGRRWTTETTFAAAKRIAGEHVSVSKSENMLQEAKLKFVFYNILLNLT
jgi:transposase